MYKIKPSVIGLGYVGLPVFIRLKKKYKTIGYDKNSLRIKFLKQKKDVNNEFKSLDLKLLNKSKYTNNSKDLKDCNFFIITVPTPLRKKTLPDLSALKRAFIEISKFIKKGDILIVESTVYPGVTREMAIEHIQIKRNLEINKDVYIGYSPERINPGDRKHQIENTKKLLAIDTKNKKIIKIIKNVYTSITKNLILSNSIEDAETAKVIENIQRDLNIALMNDIFIFCKKMNYNYDNIIKLASTKWNFLKFDAGLVGGHCLPVDPYYLSYVAKKNKISLDTVLAGRKVNAKLKDYIFQEVKKLILRIKKNKKPFKVLISGITYKKNVADLRNSYALEIYRKLKKTFKSIYAYDEFCDHFNSKKYNIIQKLGDNIKYDLVVFLVDHKTNKNLYKRIKQKNIKIYDPFKFYS